MSDWIGWLATGLFVSSYFAASPRKLRLIQGAAALLWIAYGISLGALPVVAANLLVALAVCLSLFKRNPLQPSPPPGNGTRAGRERSNSNALNFES